MVDWPSPQSTCRLVPLLYSQPTTYPSRSSGNALGQERCESLEVVTALLGRLNKSPIA